jgi:hypothetical protein
MHAQELQLTLAAEYCTCSGWKSTPWLRWLLVFKPWITDTGLGTTITALNPQWISCHLLATMLPNS